MDQVETTRLQSHLVDFALSELVRQNRESFQPLWTQESWAKLLIWMALNCGLTGERESLELFAESLGPRLTSRLRRVFFERELADLELKVLADPSEQQVLLLPQGSMDPALLSIDRVQMALEQLELIGHLETDQGLWHRLDGVLAVPWQPSADSAAPSKS